jgi:hypothetical protein
VRRSPRGSNGAVLIDEHLSAATRPAGRRMRGSVASPARLLPFRGQMPTGGASELEEGNVSNAAQPPHEQRPRPADWSQVMAWVPNESTGITRSPAADSSLAVTESNLPVRQSATSAGSEASDGTTVRGQTRSGQWETGVSTW